MGKYLSALFCGIVFSFGLVLSQMVNPAKVLGFFDVAGDWDPSLAFVMGGALITLGLSQRFILRRSSPIFEQKFHLPTLTRIDARLLIGAAVFGIGWGLVGLCPGPAITAIGYGNLDALLFTSAMAVGMVLFRLVNGRKQDKPE